MWQLHIRADDLLLGQPPFVCWEYFICVYDIDANYPDLSFASRLVLTPSLTAKLGPNGGAAKLLVRIQLITPEREFEMPELLLADNTEARSNLLSSFRTEKKRHNSSCADDIYFRKSKPVTCQASEADGLVDVSTAEKSALTTVIPELCCAMRSVV